MNDVGDEEELEEKITLKRFWKKWTLLEHMLTKEQVQSAPIFLSGTI